MSLILTQINRYDIVFAADSNITLGNNSTEKGQKIFRIPHLGAALCLAGAYSVDERRMNKWMSEHIKHDKSSSLEEFAKNIKNTLEEKMTREEKEAGCVIHISGFIEQDGQEHPEMWGIGNVDFTTDGNYTARKEGFQYREDFWSRDWEKNKLKDQFNSQGNSIYQYYINGFTPGRVGFNILSRYLNDFLGTLWSTSTYKFRPPRNLKEYESLARFTMGFIALMFNLSDYQPKYIGGKVSSFAIMPTKPLWFTL